jgi:hypothetical protein
MLSMLSMLLMTTMHLLEKVKQYINLNKYSKQQRSCRTRKIT